MTIREFFKKNNWQWPDDLIMGDDNRLYFEFWGFGDWVCFADEINDSDPGDLSAPSYEKQVGPKREPHFERVLGQEVGL